MRDILIAIPYIEEMYTNTLYETFDSLGYKIL